VGVVAETTDKLVLLVELVVVVVVRGQARLLRVVLEQLLKDLTEVRAFSLVVVVVVVLVAMATMPLAAKVG
jgi:hypothetical protein